VAPYLEAGLTWWIEALGWWRGSPRDAMRRVRQGPPASTSPANPGQPNDSGS
jgi:hypothetical protein